LLTTLDVTANGNRCELIAIETNSGCDELASGGGAICIGARIDRNLRPHLSYAVDGWKELGQEPCDVSMRCQRELRTCQGRTRTWIKQPHQNGLRDRLRVCNSQARIQVRFCLGRQVRRSDSIRRLHANFRKKRRSIT